MMKVTYQCAWCSKVIGSSVFPSDETDSVTSHTICESCKKHLLEEAVRPFSNKTTPKATYMKGACNER